MKLKVRHEETLNLMNRLEKKILYEIDTLSEE